MYMAVIKAHDRFLSPCLKQSWPVSPGGNSQSYLQGQKPVVQLVTAFPAIHLKSWRCVYVHGCHQGARPLFESVPEAKLACFSWRQQPKLPPGIEASSVASATTSQSTSAL
eukprot:TRINITY_DN80058_c0_g1_i1.p1 TRINITY_DN80058_c0_g1~~TRINITY_DN80058_c0_g1_i1.p1  ORF type:complete len:111 (+),score=8.30 TRINITY_DN80058_c0_g1_i1:91-423(+)